MKKIMRILLLSTFLMLVVVILLFYWYISNKQNSGSVMKHGTKINLLDKDLDPDEKILRGIIFISNSEDKELIDYAYFVNFNKDENKINFYKLPGNMIFETSNELYRNLSTSLAGIPQVVKLSHLYKYNRNKRGLKAAMLMLDDYLGLNLKHFLLLKSDASNKIFSTNIGFSYEFINLFKNADNKRIKAFVNDMYNSNFTDIKEKTYVKLLKNLKEIPSENIKFENVESKRFDSGVTVDITKIQD